MSVSVSLVSSDAYMLKHISKNKEQSLPASPRLDIDVHTFLLARFDYRLYARTRLVMVGAVV